MDDYDYDRRGRSAGGDGGGGGGRRAGKYRDPNDNYDDDDFDIREKSAPGGGGGGGGGGGQGTLQRLDSIQDPEKRYVLKDVIGSGVCGDVYEAIDQQAEDIGSPNWMAPEMVTSKAAGSDSGYGSRADVWAVGITAIELADGKPPFQDMHPTRALFQIVRNPPPTLLTESKFEEKVFNILGFVVVHVFAVCLLETDAIYDSYAPSPSPYGRPISHEDQYESNVVYRSSGSRRDSSEWSPNEMIRMSEKYGREGAWSAGGDRSNNTGDVSESITTELAPGIVVEGYVSELWTIKLTRVMNMEIMRRSEERVN